MTELAFKIADVPEKTGPKDPETEYVRMRLVELTRDQDAKSLALAAGLPPSAISQVRSGGLRIGPKTKPRWARLLGMAVPEMTLAAYRWWETEGKQVAAIAEETEEYGAPTGAHEEYRRAIDLLRLARSPTPAEVRAVLGALRPEKLAGLTDLEILQRMVNLIEIDRLRRVQERAVKRAEESALRAEEKAARRDWKEEKAERGHGREPGHDAGVQHEEAKKPKPKSGSPPAKKPRKHAG